MGNTTFFPVHLLTLALFGYAIWSILHFERFSKHKIAVFLLLDILIFPLMQSGVNFMRTSALWLWNHELKSIDIEQARIYVSSSSEEAKVNISLELADYSRKPSTFNIRLHLPESLHNHFQAEQYEFDYSYNFSRGARWHIQETITVPRTWTADPDDFRWFCEQWVDITLVFELYNEEHSVKFRSR